MINRQNYHWAREYLQYLQSTKNLAPDSVKATWSRLKYLLLWAWDILLSEANTIKPTFGDHVNNIRTSRKGKNNEALSAEARKKIILAAKCFFVWAKKYHEDDFRNLPGYWADDFKPPKIRASSEDRAFITYDEIIAIASMEIPENDLIRRRTQAACCFLYAAGQRAKAFTTTPLAAVDMKELVLHQDPEKYGVETKDGKSAITLYLPIPEVLQRIREWDEFLRSNVPQKFWNAYPWYAHFENHWGDITFSFETPGKNRHQALGDDLASFHQEVSISLVKTAHSYRHGHVQYGLDHCPSVAHYHMISRNVMHASVAITDQIYARLDIDERKQLMSELTPGKVVHMNAELVKLIKSLSKKPLIEALSDLSAILSAV